MGWGMALAVSLLTLGAGAGERIEVRVTLDGSGRVGSHGPSLRGLGGLAARALLAQTLGPGVRIEFGTDEAVVTIDPARLRKRDGSALKSRMRDLRKQARLVPDPPESYGFHARGSYRPNDPARPTVCLVHGINSTGESFRHLAAALEDEGYGVVLYEYPYDRDLAVSAGTFMNEWEGFRSGRGEARPWSIVTHSMGALLARSYVESDRFAGDVDHLILLGPTNHGAAVAKVQPLLNAVHAISEAGDAPERAIRGEGLAPGAAEDLTPGSAFLEALNRRKRPASVGYHILAGDAGFLTREKRANVEAHLDAAAKAGGLVGTVSRLAAAEAASALDEITEGTGDGCVAVASTRLDGVGDHEVIPANHVELIRGPLLYPDPGPIACLPFVLKRLPRPAPGSGGATGLKPPPGR